MTAKTLQIESIDRITDDTFVLNFSDDTLVILTEQELLERYSDRRMTAEGLSNMLDSN
jgi:hypothetical protein